MHLTDWFVSMFWVCDHCLLSQVIGAEYGEGFETFRPDGPMKVDVVRGKRWSKTSYILAV